MQIYNFYFKKPNIYTKLLTKLIPRVSTVGLLLCKSVITTFIVLLTGTNVRIYFDKT